MKKNLIKSFVLIVMGIVMFMAGVTSAGLLTGIGWVGSSYAGGFERGDSGPAWTKCKSACSNAVQPLICKSGCQIFYDIVANWSGFSRAHIGPAWTKCKQQCVDKEFLFPYCQGGCDIYNNIAQNW